MKIFLVLLLSLCLAACNNASDKPAAQVPVVKRDTPAIAPTEAPNPYAATDVSPVDISYFPPDFPVQKMMDSVTGQPVARIIYSRPHKQGRSIFGNLIKWGEVWRLGANEATELELFKPVIIDGKKVEKGRYVLFAIPQPEEWTLIFNTNVYSWGLRHDANKDVHRFTVRTTPVAQPIEYFTMVFEKTATGANLVVSWENVLARLPFTF